LKITCEGSFGRYALSKLCFLFVYIIYIYILNLSNGEHLNCVRISNVRKWRFTDCIKYRERFNKCEQFNSSIQFSSTLIFGVHTDCEIKRRMETYLMSSNFVLNFKKINSMRKTERHERKKVGDSRLYISFHFLSGFIFFQGC